MGLSVKELTAHSWEKQLAINHFGHAFLIQRLQAKLISQAHASRIVILSSTAHRIGTMVAENMHFDPPRMYAGWKAYSKLCNLLWAKVLANELKSTSVVVASCHPGRIATDLWNHVNPVLRNLLLAFWMDKDIPQVSNISFPVIFKAYKSSSIFSPYFFNLSDTVFC